jgi:hypothetical protein
MKVMSLLASLRNDPEQPRWDLIVLISCYYSDWATLSSLVVPLADSLLMLDFQSSRRIQEGRQNSWV